MYRVISPRNSFVQFGESNATTSCNFADIVQCLPVYLFDDVYFQFVVQADDAEEADALCDLTNGMVVVSLAIDCVGPFIKTFTQKPDRFRISDTQVLYNWSHGLPGFDAVVPVAGCFVIKVVVNEVVTGCSNCFQRIYSDCHTSVLEYGNDDNFAGFNYCNSAGVDSDTGQCDPTFVSFTNAATLVIPYTASLLAKYGGLPTLKVWIYDVDGQLTNMSVSQKFDAYPPNEIRLDFGGPASGILKIS
jgi:hypothetical protein